MMEQYERYALRRREEARAGQPIVYQYEPIPKTMRAQAFHALQAAGGSQYNNRGHANPYWKMLENRLMREHGHFHRLPTTNAGYTTSKYFHFERVSEYLLTVDTDQFIDAIELGFREAQEPYVQYLGGSYNQSQIQRVKDAATELNRRFRHHDLGYSFVGFPGTIIRMNSQYVHVETVEPAIAQLSAFGWQGPLDEFLAAHRHYRRGDYKAAMNEALKAFESTMKAILQARGCQYEESWQAKNLIRALFDNGLMPRGLESYFGGIRSVLESGVPMLRNKQSGHGQGSVISEVPEHIAAFTLHLTATNIVFLLSAHASLPLTAPSVQGS